MKGLLSLGNDVDDGFGKRLRSLLRQIVSNAAFDGSVFVPARELLGIGGGLRMRRAGCVPLPRDGWHVDDRTQSELLVQVIEFAFTIGEAETPTIVVDRDCHMIGVVKSCRAPIEGGVVKLPLRRGELPNQLCEVTGILFVTRAPALGGEVELIPPCEFGLRRQRRLF